MEALDITLTNAEMSMLTYLRAATPNRDGWVEFRGGEPDAQRRMDLDILVLAGLAERRQGRGDLEPRWFNQWRIVKNPS